MAESLGMATWQVPLPSWRTMAPQIAIFFVFEDMFHYVGKNVLYCRSILISDSFEISSPGTPHQHPIQAHPQNPS
jgi:hypothetical protein